MMDKNQIRPLLQQRREKISPLLFHLSQYLKEAFIMSSMKMEFKLKMNNEIVSEHDLYINDKLNELRKEFFKEDGFLSEESAYEPSKNLFTWVLDPIDGSSNFVYSVNLFCISLSIFYKNEAVLSYIMDPLKGTLYESFFDENFIILKEKDKREKIDPLYTVASPKQEGEYFLGGSVFAKYKVQLMEPIRKSFDSFLNEADYYRSMGCIALEILLSSLRPLFTFFSLKVRNFDIAAALHFAKNMGYSFIIGKKDEFLFIYPHVLAENPFLKDFLGTIKAKWETLALNTMLIDDKLFK
jgi:fructose-1,6-bisphosphatase/inositol monophosphatase family enzyme